MFKKDSIHFLQELRENNNREWFAENKAWYESARNDYELLVSQVIHSIGAFDSRLSNLDPKKCIFRIYRDTRFSPDKTPYKTHFGAVFTSPGLGKSSGYYLHIEPGGCFLSCGFYMLMPDQLKKVRKGIYNDFDTLRAIFDEKGFKEQIGNDFFKDDDMLQRVPNGFDKNHPAAEYMKLKHFYVVKDIPDKEIFREDFPQYAAGIYRIMHPLFLYLNEFLEE